MAGSFVSFFTGGGWKKLPWKNSWFTLGLFTAAFSGGLLVADLTGGTHSGGGSHANEGTPGGYANGSPAAPTQPAAPSAPNAPASPSYFPKLPFFQNPGSLAVTAEPANATVHIDGQGDQAAPANYPQIKVGHYEVTVSAPGYETAKQTVDIHESQPSSLSFVLQRAMGTLNLTTIPAHVSYSIKPADGSEEARTGKTPAEGFPLASGDYTISLESPRDGSLSRPVTIAPHQASSQLLDLVREHAAANASPTVAGVLRGQTEASTLNAADKVEYISALNDVFNEYVRVGAFPQAQGVIDTLNEFGQNTQAQVQHLADLRTGFEQRITDAVKDLIAQGKLGAARSKLKAAEDDAPDEVANRLNTTFTPTLGPYAAQIDAAVAAANAGDPQAGFTSLQPLAQQHPDDVTVALAMAHLITRLPPDHGRISTQLAALQTFNAGDLISTDGSDLQQMESKLQNELATYDKLAAAVEQEKESASPSNHAERMAELAHEIARDRAQIAGASGVNNAVDSLTTGLFHTHVHVVDVSEKQAEISRDEARIQQLQSADTLSKTGSSAAQQNLDAFCAQVPW